MSLMRAAALVALLCAGAQASWDAGKDLNDAIAERTDGRLRLIFELRSRFEHRPGQSFGLEHDLLSDFTRVRAGLSYKPYSWIRLTAVAMDARAPLYGTPAPSSARDPLDLHESFIEIRPEQKTGFGAILGRATANYGETRLIGSPQWAYIPRVYDGARVYWRNARLRLEALMLSPVKLTSADWNKPVMGDRVEGTYNVVNINKYAAADVYYLRHHQNRPGGFNGVGRLITNSYGTRFFGPIAHGFRYSAEGVVQSGKIGTIPHRAYAWVVEGGRQMTWLRKPFDISVEYKYASGGSRSDRSNTFDALFPAAHDKLGHADFLGWRNVRNVKAFATWSLTSSLTVMAMYNNSWLAHPRDAVYNSQGRAVARSPLGVAGTHIGQEIDLYFAYKKSGWTMGAGIGHLFAGEFIRKATPGISPQLAYVFQSYSF
jgi:hypothetical protein